MTNEEIKAWIITKMDSEFIRGKMCDERRLSVRPRWLVTQFVASGNAYSRADAVQKIQHATGELLREERVFAAGAVGYLTVKAQTPFDLIHSLEVTAYVLGKTETLPKDLQTAALMKAR